VLTDDYRVRLEAFEGPLDLLLYLIRKDEVDVHDIPVAKIAGQYIGFLKGIERIDIDVAGEFLLMAATLMELKSRILSTKPAAEGEDSTPERMAQDPRAELVRQLLAYKKYRDAATTLEVREDDWRRRFGAAKSGVDDAALAAAIEAAPEIELEDLDLLDLVEAFQKVAETVNFERLGEHQVQYDDTPIELHAEDIVDRLKSHAADLIADPTAGLAAAPDPAARDLEFVSLFTARKRSEMVGLFLALLELCRRRAVAFRHDASGAIRIRLRSDEETALDAQQRSDQEAREVPQESEPVDRVRRPRKPKPNVDPTADEPAAPAET